MTTLAELPKDSYQVRGVNAKPKRKQAPPVHGLDRMTHFDNNLRIEHHKYGRETVKTLVAANYPFTPKEGRSILKLLEDLGRAGLYKLAHSNDPQGRFPQDWCRPLVALLGHHNPPKVLEALLNKPHTNNPPAPYSLTRAKQLTPRIRLEEYRNGKHPMRSLKVSDGRVSLTVTKGDVEGLLEHLTMWGEDDLYYHVQSLIQGNHLDDDLILPTRGEDHKIVSVTIGGINVSLASAHLWLDLLSLPNLMAALHWVGEEVKRPKGRHTWMVQEVLI